MRQPITYTMEEVKQILGCEEDTVRTLLHDGLVAGIKLGRSWIFPCAAFEDVLNKLAREATEDRRSECHIPIKKKAQVMQGWPPEPKQANSRRRIMPVLAPYPSPQAGC